MHFQRKCAPKYARVFFFFGMGTKVKFNAAKVEELKENSISLTPRKTARAAVGLEKPT